jgi:hypothetical protein
MEAPSITDHLSFHDRARPDNAHVASQDVEELGQLIEAGLSQKGADPCDPGVHAKLVIALPLGARYRVGFKQRVQPSFRVRHHGAKLEAFEPFAADPDTLVSEKDGTTVA